MKQADQPKPKTPVRLSYTIQELRTLLPKGKTGKGYHEDTILRWLKRHQVPVDRIGRDNVVWLADLVEAFPQFGRSVERQRDLEEA